MSVSPIYTPITTYSNPPPYSHVPTRAEPTASILQVDRQDPYYPPPGAPAVATTWNGGDYGPAATPPPGYLNFQQATTSMLGKQPAAIAGIVIAGVAILVLGFVIYWTVFRRRRRRGVKNVVKSNGDMSTGD